MQLIDLAGSENVKLAGNTGERAREVRRLSQECMIVDDSLLTEIERRDQQVFGDSAERH